MLRTWNVASHIGEDPHKHEGVWWRRYRKPRTPLDVDSTFFTVLEYNGQANLKRVKRNLSAYCVPSLFLCAGGRNQTFVHRICGKLSSGIMLTRARKIIKRTKYGTHHHILDIQQSSVMCWTCL